MSKEITYFDKTVGWSTSAMPLVLHYCARDETRSKKNCLEDGNKFLEKFFDCGLAKIDENICQKSVNKTQYIIENMLSEDDEKIF